MGASTEKQTKEFERQGFEELFCVVPQPSGCVLLLIRIELQKATSMYTYKLQLQKMFFHWSLVVFTHAKRFYVSKYIVIA